MQVIASQPSWYNDQEKWLAILPLYHVAGAFTFVFLSRELM
jgi:4-coumarate--CoA ligase